jgi:hypothetical protein
MDEVGRRLEDIAYSETHGYQLSEDMSQYVASRYYELASGPYRGLGAPSLLDTTPSPSQRAARDLVIGKILENYVRSEVEIVQSHLVDPTIAMGAVDGPVRLTMERPRALVMGRQPTLPAQSTHPAEHGVARNCSRARPNSIAPNATDRMSTIRPCKAPKVCMRNTLIEPTQSGLRTARIKSLTSR